MKIDKEAEKVLWSLQNNKRNEAERKAFKPTGKKPKSNNLKYIVVVLLAILALSFLLTQFQKEDIQICITSNFCFNSQSDLLLYTLYIFTTNIILVFGIYFAYKLGSFLARRLQ